MLTELVRGAVTLSGNMCVYRATIVTGTRRNLSPTGLHHKGSLRAKTIDLHYRHPITYPCTTLSSHTHPSNLKNYPMVTHTPLFIFAVPTLTPQFSTFLGPSPRLLSHYPMSSSHSLQPWISATQFSPSSVSHISTPLHPMDVT